MPDDLKAGTEALSGYSMDDVKVHYNSDNPAQLQALAYAQGTDIHVASGQEKHLPHEAWHVVQQKQGRVQPMVQMKGEIAINDNKELEDEADVMGNNAVKRYSNPDVHKSVDSQYKKQSYSIIQKVGYNSVPLDFFTNAVGEISSYKWATGTSERTIKVWNIAKDNNWDFHLSAMCDKTGVNVTKFHFTLRRGPGKGEDAFAWFDIIGHNQNAALAARADAGVIALFNDPTLPLGIQAHINQINNYSNLIFSKAKSFIK